MSIPLEVFATATDYVTDENRVNLINELLDSQLELIAQKDYGELDKIDQELYNLGVKKLTFEEVLKIDGTEVMPYVDYPIADNI